MAELDALIRRTPTRGKTHIFLGHPLSDLCDKTTVEPGNTYSPGVWTCGISLWVDVNDTWYTPDLLADNQISWGFAGATGCPPILEAHFSAGDTVQVNHRLAYLGGEGAEGTDFSEVTLTSTVATNATLAIVIRDCGPAGGKIDSLAWDESHQTMLINDSIRLHVENTPTAYQILPADTQHDSPVGIIMFQVALAAAESQQVAFTTRHGFTNRAFAAQLPPTHRHDGLTVKNAFKQSQLEWQHALPARIYAPDARVVQAWEASASHILANMECGLPRVGAINYPVFWIRDCVSVLRALDLFGRHDLARIGNDYLAPLYFSGGFGAEADAPGEGLWSLVTHAEITGNNEWLAPVFPHIRQRVEWIERMLATPVPLRAMTENRIPHYTCSPGCNIVCLPAENGLINGRMDWHSPNFYINCWAACGLNSAASAASQLGHYDLATQWLDKAIALDDAIARFLLPHYGNERDAVVTPHPTSAVTGETDILAEHFRHWYVQNRLTPDRQRNPERLWTYFEATQIHNAMLLGFKHAAWINLDGMLHDGTSPWPLYAYPEGKPQGNEYLPYLNGQSCRGWLHAPDAAGGNMPHLWTAAEMIALIRDMFVREEDDSLILGMGIPEDWLQPGARFGVRDMPTNLGPVSYFVVVQPDGEMTIE
ncbi:MAG TPA: hypothetical protein VHV83_14090, partial [Armatimonadota bacterium]|nr:hypothetical protein [Armatimonadota bacterium]